MALIISLTSIAFITTSTPTDTKQPATTNQSETAISAVPEETTKNVTTTLPSAITKPDTTGQSMANISVDSGQGVKNDSSKGTNSTGHTMFGVEIKWDWGNGGIEPNPTVDMEKMANMISGLGAKWVRLYSGVNWASIEPVEGQYYWNYLDYVINLYRSRAVELLYIAAGTPRWAASGNGSDVNPPKDMNWYKEFCRQVVARYNLKVIELLNEPYYFYNGTVDEYVAQIHAGWEGAKEANPNCTVVAGYGGGDIDNIYDTTFPLNALLEQGFFDYIDGLVIHPYSGRNAPETLEPQWSLLQDYLAQHGKSGFPIYATEWGYPADLGLDVQADYIVRSAEMQQSWGVRMSIYFDFFNTLVGQGGWDDKELVSDWNLTARPSYYAYRDYIQQNST